MGEMDCLSAPGTAADRFDGQIPHSLKLERAARLREAVGRKQQAFLAEQLKLPHMLVAADNPQAFADSATDAAPMQESAGKTKKNAVKGVNEYYAACSIRLPAQGKRPDADAGLLPARPVALTEKGLVVELIEQE